MSKSKIEESYWYKFWKMNINFVFLFPIRWNKLGLSYHWKLDKMGKEVLISVIDADAKISE